MASPCKLNKNNFYVHVNKRTYYVNNILYIYIIYRNMKIISKILNIKKVLDRTLLDILLYIYNIYLSRNYIKKISPCFLSLYKVVHRGR